MTKATRKLSKIIEWGVYVLVFLLPWQGRLVYRAGELNGRYWEYGTYSLYGTELLLIVLVLMNMVLVLKKQVEKGEKRKEKLGTTNVKLLNCSIVLLFIVAAASVLWAGDSGLTLYKFVTLLEGLMIFWLIVSTKVSWRKLVWAVVLSAVAQAGVGIWQFLSQEVIGNKWLGMAAQFPSDGGVSVVETGLRRWLRAYGTLPHPNILGGWLTIGLVFCMSLYDILYRELRSDENTRIPFGVTQGRQEYENNDFDVSHQYKKDRLQVLVLLLCYVVMLFGLLASFSRGAWVAATIVILLYCLIAFLKKDKTRRIISYKLLIISMLIVTVFGVIFREPFITRIRGEGRLETKSTEERLTSYDEALTVIKDNWLKGVGLGNYTLYLYNGDANLRMHTNDTNARMTWEYQPAHNLFLLVLAELGIFGLVSFLGLTILILRFSIQHSAFSIHFLLLLTIIILSFFDHYFWSLYFGVMVWWLVLGLGVKIGFSRD